MIDAISYPEEWPEVKAMVALANSLGGADEDTINECLLLMAKFEAANADLASTLKELLDVLAGRPDMFDLPQYRAGRAILEKAGVS